MGMWSLPARRLELIAVTMALGLTWPSTAIPVALQAWIDLSMESLIRGIGNVQATGLRPSVLFVASLVAFPVC